MLFARRKKTILTTVVLSLLIANTAIAQDGVTNLEFGQPPMAESDTARTLQSLVKVQDPGGPCQKGLYLLTHYGDREGLFQKENQTMIDKPLIEQSWRYCSLFSTVTNDTVMMGRNWDNENVGSIIVNLYNPPGKYASICFSRAIDLGFPLHMDLDDIKSSELGKRLLLAPFYSMDGINEHGLAVGVAGNKMTAVTPSGDKERIYLPFLIRKILDETKTVDEAVKLAEKYVPFVLDGNSIAGHLMVVDSTGRSVVLEYDQDQWQKTCGAKNWQVMSTKPIYNVSDSTLRANCWRYSGISEALEKVGGKLNWRECMKILQDVSQVGTTWSVVYSPTMRELYFSVYQQWDKVYRVKFP